MKLFLSVGAFLLTVAGSLGYIGMIYNQPPQDESVQGIQIQVSPSVIPTQAPTSTSIPKKPVVVNSDPVISCTVNALCGGGTKSMKTSECNASICCGFLNNQWILYPNKSACIDAQYKENQSTVTNNSVPNNAVWPTIRIIPTPILIINTPNPWPTTAPFVVQPIDGTIHENNPTPTSGIPYGFGNY